MQYHSLSHSLPLSLYLDPEACGGQLLVAAFRQTVFPHQRGEVLQTVGVAVGGGDVEQIVAVVVSDQLQVVCRQVRLEGEAKERERQHWTRGAAAEIRGQ